MLLLIRFFIALHDALFIESHPDPSSAISDGDNCLNINDIEGLLKDVIKIHNAVKN